MGGPSTPSNTTTTTTPWGGAIPYLTTRYGSGPGPYRGGRATLSSVVPRGTRGGGGGSYGSGPLAALYDRFSPSGGGSDGGDGGGGVPGSNIPGIFPAAADYFGAFSGLSPEQEEARQSYLGTLEGRQNDIGEAFPTDAVLSGAYDPNIKPVGNYFSNASYTPGTPQISNTPRLGSTPTSQNRYNSLLSEYQRLGGVNPARALQNQLAGDPTRNPYLREMHQANINDAQRAYQDNLKDLRQRVLPGIASDAFASGGYGGSRQGIAEGLALQEATEGARDIAINAQDVGKELYGQAFQDAQNRQLQAAGQLSGQAQDIGAFNAQNALQNQQFNVGNMIENRRFDVGNQIDTQRFNVGNLLQNRQYLSDLLTRNNQFNAQQGLEADQIRNQMELERAAQMLGNRVTGADLYEREQGLSDNVYNQIQALLQAPQNQYANALNQYASIITPGAGLGSTTNQQVPIYSNTGGQIIGGASALGGLLSALG